MKTIVRDMFRWIITITITIMGFVWVQMVIQANFPNLDVIIANISDIIISIVVTYSLSYLVYFPEKQFNRQMIGMLTGSPVVCMFSVCNTQAQLGLFTSTTMMWLMGFQVVLMALITFAFLSLNVRLEEKMILYQARSAPDTCDL